MHLLQWLPNMAADIMYSCIWGWSPGLCSRRFTAAVRTYHYRSSPTSPADFNIAEMIETAIHHGCIEASLPADRPLQTVTQPSLSPCLYLCQLYLQPAHKVYTLHQLCTLQIARSSVLLLCFTLQRFATVHNVTTLTATLLPMKVPTRPAISHQWWWWLFWYRPQSAKFQFAAIDTSLMMTHEVKSSLEKVHHWVE